MCIRDRRGIAATLPRKLKKKKIPTRQGHAYVAISNDGQVLLRRRPDKGLLGGMMEVPGSDWSETPKNVPPFNADWKKQSGVVEHTFTHFHLEVTVWVTKNVERVALDETYRWVPLDEVDSEALPTVMRKILKLGLS
jgi:A/G-specific adenine glycosylase